MSHSAYLIPRPIGRLLSALPAYPGSVLFAQVLNRSLGKLLPEDLRQSLRNKRIRINATDAQLSFDFLWDGKRFAACKRQSSPDLTISASVHDFFLLAKRQEDPDTLFFSRRLLMEGDTELALAVKNLLDAIEVQIFPFAELVPQELMEFIRKKMEHPGRKARTFDH